MLKLNPYDDVYDENDDKSVLENLAILDVIQMKRRLMRDSKL